MTTGDTFRADIQELTERVAALGHDIREFREWARNLHVVLTAHDLQAAEMRELFGVAVEPPVRDEGEALHSLFG